MGIGPVQFITPLSPMLWAVLAGVPVGIIALYFLKLRRRPVQVPSTLLWRRSLEDLHVNSLFQRRSSRLRLQRDRKSTRLNSSHTVISYAVFCLKKKNQSKAN